MKIAKLILLLFFALQLGSAHAAAIDASKSSVTATFKQIGVEVTAKFKTLHGAIDFDPANPANGKAQIAVALSDFDLGEAEYNQELQKKAWFDAAQFPQATFVSNSIKAAGAGKLLVQGKLSIKGKVLDVTVPVAYKQEGKTQSFEGALPIKRLYFNIGEGEWKDTDTLADEVTIKFNVVTEN